MIPSDVENAPKNVLDCLLLEAIFLLTQQTKTVTSPTRSQTKKQREFGGFLVDLHSFDRKTSSDGGMNLQVNIQNLMLTNLMHTLINTFHNNSKAPRVSSLERLATTQSDNFYLTELPAQVAKKFGLESLSDPVFARVCVLNQPTASTANVKFIDYAFESVVERASLFRVSKHLMKIFKLLPNTVETTYNLHLDLNANLIPEKHYEHLYEIFKLLINYELIERFSFSSKLKCVFSHNKQVRLYDSNRDNLDINRIMELSMLAFIKPFTGVITHMNEDYKQFDCLHEMAKKNGTITELEKIFQLTDLFKLDEKDSSDFLTCFALGELCMINLSSRVEQTNNGASILMLSEHVIDETIQQEPVKKELFRAIVIDQSDDLQKLIVLNVDTGKQMTLNNNRVAHIESKNSYCILAQIIPFMMIKAKLEAKFDDLNVQRAIYNSKYYGNKIQVNTVGSWTLGKRGNMIEVPSSSQSNGKFNYEKFAQTEKDLCKLVELLNLGIN